MGTAQLRQTTLPVTSKYGKRILNGRENTHKGTDFPFGKNTPISAFGSGVVTFAGRAPYYIPGTKKQHPDYERGLYVEISHAPGIGTSYHSLSRATVSAGDSVSMGDTIGYGGRTAVGATGEHCHVGLWINGNHVDLEKWLTPGVVVTLSVDDGRVSTGGSKPFEVAKPADVSGEPIEIKKKEDDVLKVFGNIDEGGMVYVFGEFTWQRIGSASDAHNLTMALTGKPEAEKLYGGQINILKGIVEQNMKTLKAK